MLYILLLVTTAALGPASSFIVGGCSVLERYLNAKQKAELRKLIHSKFDGINSEQVLASSNTYVHSPISRLFEFSNISITPFFAYSKFRINECSNKSNNRLNFMNNKDGDFSFNQVVV
ncbi:unnamed protein product [Heligmosomoides polygyrus]|uniref:CNNM transmembrane domain-containing protein n=1 Tax=Heligmosomoides polygyrus TaxID=6339 RepID=A0A183GKQ8_HELPZ|nr:unnamed protein product [Heligmosomoides polygyrus]